MLEVRAPAKVNLSLKIVARRPDGFHDLDSVVAFAGLHDRLVLAPGRAAGPALRLDGPQAASLRAAQAPGSANLVCEAVARFRRATGWDRPVTIRLTKRIPVAAGLGGGSADAAAALLGLNRLAGRPLTAAALTELAGGIGADTACCLLAHSLRLTGIGQVAGRLPEPGRNGLLLANSGIALATASVFRAWRPGEAGPPGSVPMAGPPLGDWPPGDWQALVGWLGRAGSNDLTGPACRLAPSVAPVLAALAGLPGIRISGMSGSGATCFALFDDAAAARAGARRLRRSRPGWWIRATRLRDWQARDRCRMTGDGNGKGYPPV